MEKFTFFLSNSLSLRMLRSNAGIWMKTCTACLVLGILLFPFTTVYGQSGSLSQIRNGDGQVHQGVLDTCGKCWVNGNAGSSNAHYTEGMSIAYRSLLTGLTPNRYYEYEIGFDTYHSAMAIDYLTHFQRLEPHGPFGHPAEVIRPLIFLSGSTEYTMRVVAGGVDTLGFPAPSPSGITSGAFNKDGTPRDVSNQARTSFLALPAAQRVMTIYNGDLINICYIQENPIVIGGADAESRMRVRFKALSDSVVLAWGGHIASRLDWGYFQKSGKLVPLSAAGISGSPYHMRQKAFYEVSSTKVAGVCDPGTFTTLFSGFGNQDRSLSAAAVIPPPECPTVTSKTQCYQDSSFSFSIASPVSGVTYTWSFGANTIGAVFSGSNVGNSVTVIAHPGPDTAGVNDGGSFTLNITASQNGIDQSCPGVATGTLVDVDVTASAFSTSIDLSVKDTTHLFSTPSGGTTPYTFLWKALEPGSSFSSATAQNPVVTVPHSAGTYTYRVIVTDANSCKDSATVQIVVGAQTPPCGVSGPNLVCPSSTHTYVYDPDGNGTVNRIPTNFTASWSLINNTAGAILTVLTDSTVSVQAGTSCNKSYTVKLTLTSNSGLISTSCDTTVSVNVSKLPTITCPGDPGNFSCIADVPAPPTSQAALKTFFTDAGGTIDGDCGLTLSYRDDTTAQNCFAYIQRTWTVTDSCGNAASCAQVIKVVDRTAPSVTCTANPAPVPCGQSIPVPSASDNCGTVTSFFRDNPANAAANRQPLTRTWTFVDASGNTTTCVQNITFAACPNVLNTSTTKVNTASTTIATNGTSNTLKSVVRENVKTPQVQAFPNPYFSSINFKVVSPVTGQASLEIYDLIGRRLAVVYQGVLEAGVSKSISYKVPLANRVPLIYKLNVGGNSSRGKLMPDKGLTPEP